MLPNRVPGFIPTVDLEAVVAALAPRLIAYALARTRSRGDAEDIAQDALTALIRRWRQTGPPESPDAFAFAIAKRRATRVNARRALMAPLDVLRNSAGREPDGERAIDRHRELTLVMAAVSSLSRLDREALLLRAAGELSFQEIAAVLRTSTAAAKMRVSRARRRLAARLSEHVHGR